MIYALPLGSAVLGGVLAWVMARWLGWRGLTGLVLPWAVAVVAVHWASRNPQGWDGLGYAVALILMVLPVGPGIALGGGLGLYRRSKSGQKAGHD